MIINSKDSIENFHIGFEYLLEAAEKDDKQSLYYAARAYDSGIGLPDNMFVLNLFDF